MQNIDSKAGIKQYGGTKEWIFVKCDGLPYKIIRDLIANVWSCQICQPCFYKLGVFQEHKCFFKNKNNQTPEFSWLVPISGLLHLELNACSTFIP